MKLVIRLSGKPAYILGALAGLIAQHGNKPVKEIGK
jgi:stage V sporulation protein SpoVS